MASERFFQGLYYDNLGIAYNGGTGVFTVQGANGRSLSTSNPAVIILPSNASPGQFTRYDVTANQAFIDDVGSSEIIDNLFGWTTSIAVASDCPFYIYAVGNDNEDAIQFMISRIPHAIISPTVGEIGAPDDAVADEEYSFWSIDNITETAWDTNPCLCIGSFRMRMTTSDDWTVQALADGDGIDQFHEETFFSMPLGQNGAASGNLIFTNGGTAPAWSTVQSEYKLERTGLCYYRFYMNGDAGTDGSGSVSLLMALPFIVDKDSVHSNPISSSSLQFAGGALLTTVLGGSSASAANLAFFNPAGSFMQNGDFTNGARQLSGAAYYRIRAEA